MRRAGGRGAVPARTHSLRSRTGGLPNERFYFEGFLPQKKGRLTRLQQLATLDHSFILYESPFRLVKTLSQLADILGNERRAAVSREISKIHEETRRGTLSELAVHITQTPPKGDIVIIVAGK